MNEFTRDDRLQIAADIKAQLSALYRELAELAFVAAEEDDAGAVASHLVTSTQEVNLWAWVYEELGPDAIEDTAPLDARWWRAIKSAKDPWFAHQVALNEELKTADIKARFGSKRQKRKPPLYRGSATVERWQDGRAVLNVDLGADPVPPGKKCRLEVKEK